MDFAEELASLRESDFISAAPEPVEAHAIPSELEEIVENAGFLEAQ